MRHPPDSLDAILQALLKDQEAGLTLEALLQGLRQKTRRHVSPDKLGQHMRANPQHYHWHNERWRLARYEAKDRQRRRQQSLAALDRPHGPGQALRGDRYVVLDLETTGTDPRADRPIEVAAIRYVDGREVDRYATLVAPGVALSQAVTRVTGLTEADLRDAPPLEAVLPALIAFVAGDPLVGHNLSRFDWPMLACLAEALGLEWSEPPLVDTLQLSLLFFPRLSSHSLEAVGAHLEVLRDDDLHRATADVELCHRVFEALRREPERDPALQAILATLLPVAEWPALHFMRPPAERLTFTGALDTMRPILLPLERPEPLGYVDWDAVSVELARGGERRVGQEEMARRVAGALQNERRLIVEAPTGTGKTRAYLLPAIAHARATGQRVIVAPNSLVLQDQVVSELSCMPDPPRVCRYMGRQNLVCRMHLRRFAKLAAQQPGAYPLSWRLALVQVLSALRGGSEGFLRGLATFWLDEGDPAGEGRLLREELAIGEGCMERPNPNAREVQCYGQAMVLNSQRCEILVSNQVMVLRNLAALQPYGNMVFDEAHNLEDSATLAWTSELTYDGLLTFASRLMSVDRRRGLAAELRTFHPALSSELEEWQLELRAHAEQISTQLAAYFKFKQPSRERDETEDQAIELRITDLKTREWRAVDECLEPLQDLLLRMAERLGEEAPVLADDLKPTIAALSENLTSMVELIADFRKLAGRQEQVYSLGHGRGTWYFRREPLDVSETLAMVYREARSVVWTSATLTIENSFDFMSRRLGIAHLTEPTEEALLDPAFDYARNALLVLTNHLPTPRGVALVREFPHHVAQELARFIRYYRGRLLGLFTSRRRMLAVADQAQGLVLRDGYHVYVQGGNLSGTIERFRREFTSSLFGVKSLWEGISIEGESLSFVAISKLPFPIPTPLKLARAEHYHQSTGRSSFLEYDVPLAVMQFKQGFGRLNRTASDRGAVLVLDRRLQHAMLYRDAFLRSLPGPPTVFMAKGENFYERICAFLDQPFLPDRLGEVQGTFEERLLAEYAAPSARLTQAQYRKYRPKLMAILKQLFGHDGFRPNQEEIVQAMLCGRDVFALLPTGSGKSLTFQLPALLRPGLTLVVSPLVALMKDQVDHLREKLSASIANCLVGGQTSSEVAEILDDVASGRMKILYLAPERLLEGAVIEALKRADVVQLVVDEAHCVSMWGHSFRPEFLEIRERLRFLGEIPVTGVTATAPPEIRADIMQRLEMRSPEQVIAPSLRTNLSLKVVPCATEEDRTRALIAMVRGMVLKQGFAGIVYVATRAKAEQLRELLRMQNILCAAYHAGMAPLERHAIQEQFMNGDLEVIVATNAFGMGVDKADVRFVIHFDLPDSVEMYYQEVGRAGRDGQPAYGVLIASDPGIRSREWLLHRSLPKAQDLRDFERGLRRAAGAGLFFDPDRADQERVRPEDMGQWLYFLEQAGSLRKLGGFAARVRLKLHARREVLARSLGEDAALLTKLFDRLGLKDYGQVEFDLLDLVNDPRDLEQALLRQAAKDRFSFRALRTGLILELAGGGVPFEALLERLHDERESKFARMLGFVSTRDCRWHHIRTALGDQDVPARCSGCDRCAPDQELPWDPTDIAFLPETGDLLGMADIVTEAVAHHDGELGKGSVICLLAGKLYNGSFQLSTKARQSPYFGRLQAIGYSEVKQQVDRFEKEGLIEVRPVQRGATTYQMMYLTAAGRRVLAGAAQVHDEEAEPHEIG